MDEELGAVEAGDVDDFLEGSGGGDEEAVGDLEAAEGEVIAGGEVEGGAEFFLDAVAGLAEEIEDVLLGEGGVGEAFGDEGKGFFEEGRNQGGVALDALNGLGDGGLARVLGHESAG